MSDLLAPTNARCYQSRDSRTTKAMTTAYPSHSSLLPYGLITPPSEMRYTPFDMGPGDTSRSTNVTLTNDPAHNILAPPAHTRYYLRRQPVQAPPSYPIVNNYQPNTHYPHLQVRRRSGSSSTTTSSGNITSSTTTTSYIRAASPQPDFESSDFNVGEFTAVVRTLSHGPLY